jgi:threonine dehydrogenase-like Zn-dependent dehydrogenase
MGAGRVLAVDRIASRLEMARQQGAEVIDFDKDDPVQAILELTGGIGVDRVIDAVGVDAVRAEKGAAAKSQKDAQGQLDEERKEIVPQQNPHDGHWQPGSGPSQVLRWAVKAVAKAGTVSIIGVYPEGDRFFPIGEAMNRNLSIKMGNCNHRSITPKLLELVRNDSFDPVSVLTQREPIMNAIDAYHAFDAREPGWIKVKLEP